MKRATLLMAAAVLCLAPAAALAQKVPAAAAQKAFKPPRNALGQPDLSGVWSNATLTPTTRPVLYGKRAVHTAEEVRLLEAANAQKAEDGNKPSQETSAGGSSDNVGAYDRAWIDGGSHVMRVGGEPRTSLVTTEDGQVPPRKGQPPRTLPANAGSIEAGLQAVKQAASVDIVAAQGAVGLATAAARSGQFDNPEARSLGERCLLSFGRNGGPPMFPNGWYNNNYQFAQSRDAVVITIEMVHDARVIRLNAKHRTDGIRPWFGDSIGHYEGDTLVVETTNIPQRQAYSGSWEHLKVTERFTRVGKDRMHYRFVVEDPTIWDKPWGGEYEFWALGGEVLEYACHEGNYALEGILAGAREDEKKAAAEGKPVASR